MALTKENNIHNVITWRKNSSMGLVTDGVLIGIISGLIVVLYRFLLGRSEAFAREAYAFLVQKPYLVPFWAAFLVVTGYLIGTLIKFEPMISGSGIPQVEGLLLRKLGMNWWKVILGKFIGGIMSIGAGLSLGREGPSVQLGAAAAQGFCRVFNKMKVEEKFLITSGASAGLSAAFNAPLAGIMFALEEVHKSFSPMVLLAVMPASLTAGYIAKNFFGMSPAFSLEIVSVLPLNHYVYLIILGAILGVFGTVFNRFIIKSLKFYRKQKWLPIQFRPAAALLVACIVGFYFPQALGGGHELIASLEQSMFPLGFLLSLLAVKFFFTMISYGSGAPGGIFLPLLVIGALTGHLYGSALVTFLGVNQQYVNNFIILAMVGYFTAIVKAPITGVILITEMTGNFSHLLALSVVALTSYVTADILSSRPIYESLLDLTILQNSNSYKGHARTKVLLEIPVPMGTAIDSRMIKEINWPPDCLLVGIKRGQEEIIPNGSTVLLPGDFLIILVDELNAPGVKQALLGMNQLCLLGSER
ncbi:MAG: Voltage-gated H(+)/2Cl(-) exchange transporter ClcA [Firmicutes bacterium]|nr:Voltage-gated H(+)/2Cl(-) exchange transporter ClcA [Bacillota bacterium]MDI6706876.1 ClC family H(+)/Cl(-) exchange transporter [Bacillota bacterium]